MSTDKSEILERSIRGLCPHCGQHSYLKSWFQIHASCPACNKLIESESGFTLATTSISYVLSIIFILLPICVMVSMNVLSVLTGIVVAIASSLLLSVLIYPLMLKTIVTLYFYFLPNKPE